MAGTKAFVEDLYKALNKVGIKKLQCDFDEQRGNLVVNAGAGADGVTRVVPAAALAVKYAACASEHAKEEFLETVAEAFGTGATDVPRDFGQLGDRLLPQLWPQGKILELQLSLPSGAEVPRCGLHGESLPLTSAEDRETLGVVLVSVYTAASSTVSAIETPVLLHDLDRWGKSFNETLGVALENLRVRTKSGLPADKRWEYHPSGCAQSAWGDGFDAVRAALLPLLVAKRKRPEGLPEDGGQVVAFATPSCVLATTSKNALGLCFMGDTMHTKIKADASTTLLRSSAYRLMKMKDAGTAAETAHPLSAKAGEGFVWRWLPYSPGGPPLRASGEFSIPVDADEVEAILNAAEAGRQVPVFTQQDDGARAAPAAETFATKKNAANALFKAGDFVKAIAAYDAVLNMKPVPSDAEAAVAHANAAQAMLNLASAEKDEDKKQGCAAEALRRANRSAELDPSYCKAHLRCALACDILGEAQAAEEFRDRAKACGANAEANGTAAASSSAPSSSTAAAAAAAAESGKAETPGH